MPAGFLPKDTQLSLVTPESVPDYPGAEFEPLGAPIEISGKGVGRLDAPAAVTMAFDPKSLGKGADASWLRFVYHNGRQWEIIKPDQVDIKAGRATFGTYHFSLIGLTKIKDETKLTEDWVHSQALDEWLSTGDMTRKFLVANDQGFKPEPTAQSWTNVKGQVSGKISGL